MPTNQPKTLQALISIHKETKAAGTILTAKLPDAGAYGHIRNQSNQIIAIKEAKDCTNEERNIQEFNEWNLLFPIPLT